MRENQIVSAGPYHSLVVGDQGQVYAFGENYSGKLGLGDKQPRTSPEVVPGLPPVKGVIAGNNFSAFLTEQGEVYLAGSDYGLGLHEVTIPRLVSGLPPIKVMSGELRYLIMLDTQGQAWRLGSQFDIQRKPHRITDLPPIIAVSASSSFTSWLVDNQGGVRELTVKHSASNPEEIVIEKLEEYPTTVDISAGNGYELILDNQGQLWGSGTNAKGQIGLGELRYVDDPTIIPDLYQIKRMSTGPNHSLVLNEQGQVYTFGENQAGSMGIRDEDYVSERFHRSIRQSGDDESEDDEDNSIIYAHPILIPDLPAIDSISAGSIHSLITDVHGQVYSFGLNNSGQLGLGDNTFRLTPTIIPDIRAKLTSSSVPTDIITVYPIIQYLSEDIENFGIRSLTDRDSLAEYTLEDGTVYLAQIRYNSSTDQQDPPLENVEEKYYLLLETLIKNQELTEFEPTPDLYEDDLGNTGFMFKDPNQQIYLIRIYQDENGGIHRPLL